MPVDYAKGNEYDKLNGFSNETGIIGLLEAKHYDKINLVLSAIGVIPDRLCVLCDRLTTLSFVRYVELLKLILRFERRRGWSSKELQTLQIVIKEFQKASVRTFVKYQISGLSTCKWNARNHLADNM